MFSKEFRPLQAAVGFVSLLIGTVLLFFAGYHPFAYYPSGYEMLAAIGAVFVGVSFLVYLWASIGLLKSGYEAGDDSEGDSICFTSIVLVFGSLMLFMNRTSGSLWYPMSFLYQDIALIGALCSFMAMYGSSYNDDYRKEKRSEERERVKKKSDSDDEQDET